MRISWLCFGGALLALGLATRAAPGDQHVGAELLADVQSVEAGKPFTVGVLLQIQTPWHIYWKNPGDAGAATKVDWDLPPGYVAGMLQYPVPQRFEAAGNVISYGYRDSVLLLATITPPAKTQEKTIKLSAHVSYLACSDELCLPGKAAADLTLTLGPATPANEPLFTTWKGRLPVSGDDGQSPISYRVVGQLNGDATAPFALHVHWKDASRIPPHLQFFPESEPALQLTDVALSTQAQETTVQFNAKVFKGMKLTSSTLGGVLGYADADGSMHGIALSMQLAPR